MGGVYEEYHTANAFQFFAQQYEKHRGRKQCRRKKPRARQKTNIQQQFLWSTTGKNRYELKLFNATLIAWYREDCNTEKRIKC